MIKKAKAPASKIRYAGAFAFHYSLLTFHFLNKSKGRVPG